jgi:archaellum component FlaC
MNLDKLLERVKEIEDIITQATGNLHALFGRKAEVEAMIEEHKKLQVDPPEPPVVD